MIRRGKHIVSQFINHVRGKCSVILLNVVLLLFFYQAESQCPTTLNGTYTVGVNGNFTTLSAASVAYNTSCLTGPVVFLLTDSLYSTAETFPIVFENNTNASTVNTLTIKPQAGVNVGIRATIDNLPVIRIKGSHIIIDGSNNNTESQNLSMTNNSFVSPRLIYIQSKSTVPTVNICLKNMILTNGNDRSVITLGDTTGASGVLPGYFSDVTIKNNQLRRSLYGIFATAKVQSGNGNRLLIDKNDLSASSAGSMRFTGIYLRGVEGATISNNIIGNFDGTDSATDKGIWLADTVRSTTVSGNRIFNLNYTGDKGNGAHGIYLSTGFPNASIVIANNMIANLSGDGADYASGSKLIENPTGIMIDNFPANQTGIRLYHNSIFLGGIVGFTNTLNKFRSMSSCVRLKGGSVAELRNNVLVNNLGRKDSVGFGSVCIMTSAGNSQITGLDNNLYWVSPSGSGLKCLAYHFNAGNAYTTLASWRTYTNKDLSSLNVFPNFVSGNDLHLVRNLNNSINNKGAMLTGWDRDFDGSERNKINPDIGCDEFMPAYQSNWIGKYSDRWYLDSNWEAGVIANDTMDLTLENNCNYYPKITDSCAVRNLTINSGISSVSMLMDSASLLNISGNINSISGKIDASKGYLFLKGSTPQYLGNNVFIDDRISKMTIGNSSDSGVVLQGRLEVGRAIEFNSTGKTIHTNDFLTLKSTATETAYIGDLTGKSIIGRVTVERFIPTGRRHGKSWQLISVPAYGNQTINQAWQDSATSPNQNRFPGFGTMLTGAQTNATAFGFDAATPSGGASIRTYRSSDSSFQSVTSTNLPISESNAYLVMVRGDRSVTSFNASAVPTTLRVKGNIYNQLSGIPAPLQTVPVNSFELLGNPLPSAIDFRSLNMTGDVDSVFYVWDPMLPGPFNLGNYQTISAINGYLPVPGGTSNYSGNTPVTVIQSGQAFFVRGGSSGGSVAFPESAKVSGSASVFRVPISVTHDVSIKVDLLYKNDSISSLIDGVALLLDKQNVATSSSSQVRKVMSNSRGIALVANGEKLAILNSKIPEIERTYPLLLNAMADGNYGVRVTVQKNMRDSIRILLHDKYTGEKYDLLQSSGSEYVFNWGIDVGNRMPDRFEIVVTKPVVVLPVKKIRLDAVRKNNSSNVISWELEGLEGVDKVKLERSMDGIKFDSLHHIRKSNYAYIAGTYVDCSGQAGKVYYRISVLDFDGRISFSEIKMVYGSNSEPDVLVYSNGYLGNTLKIRIFNAKPGPVDFVITDINGVDIFHKKATIIKNNDDYFLEIPLMFAKSTYFLNIFTSEMVRTEKLIFSE